jgi:alpha-glucosidase (family GH31 glycosyl hydrolase)
MSIMRVHSTFSDVPHFPFLFPKDKADAMRSALQLRYQLLPHIYSLAHVQYTRGLPIARPLLMQFPDDLAVVNTVRGSFGLTSESQNLSIKLFLQVDQWMMGDSLMVTPILTSVDGQTTDTQRDVYLPDATWHQLRWQQGNFSYIASHKGPATINVAGVLISDMIVFARSGGIVFMGPLLQYVGSRSEYRMHIDTTRCAAAGVRAVLLLVYERDLCVSGQLTHYACTRMLCLVAVCSL